VAVIVGEGFPVVISFFPDPGRFLAYAGFVEGAGGPWHAWALGAVVAAIYVWSAASIPDVREHLLRPGMLKAVAVLAAVMAAVLEEVIFRRWVMDFLEREGVGSLMQVLVSGAAFGVGHVVWGFLGGSRAAVRAMVSTGILGAALAIVYLAAGRSLAPCIAAHFVITALIEPGLVIAALRGQMAARSAPALPR
jgi:hypothetical protein